jgi:hypothetical protein
MVAEPVEATSHGGTEESGGGSPRRRDTAYRVPRHDMPCPIVNAVVLVILPAPLVVGLTGCAGRVVFPAE